VHITVGKIRMGRCETLDGESVFTKFLLLGPVFVPLDSFYAFGFWGRHGGFPIKRCAKSIAFAYLRWFVAPVVLFIGFFSAMGPEATSPHLTNASGVVLTILLAAWLASVLLSGRTWGREARERRILALSVGHGAPPERLFSGTLRLVLEDLERLWEVSSAGDASYRSDARASRSWKDVYPNELSERLLPIYYALCRYQAASVDDVEEAEVMTTRARFVWERIENGWPAYEALLAEPREHPDRAAGAP
jgi:hypothetical protein